MLRLNILLSNPWASDEFKNCFNKSWLHKNNKATEIEVTYHAKSQLGLNIDLSARCDHAGVRLEVTLLGYTLSFNRYDTRHWDHDTNAWTVYDEAYFAKANAEAAAYRAEIKSKKKANKQ